MAIKKYPTPEKEELLKLFFHELKGDSHIAKIYNVSIPVVKRWKKEYGIVTKPYHGRIRHDITESEFRRDCDLLSRSQMKKKYGNYIVINNYAQKFGVSLPKSKFDEWEEERSKVKHNLEDLIGLNSNGKTLKEISKESNISIEVLKRTFRENEVSVSLHSYNKSKGELEIKSLFENFKSVKFDKKFEIDCFYEDKNFGVEYCGEYWHSTLQKDKFYHYNKWKYFFDKNIKLITIFESEWRNETKNKILRSMIDYNIGKTKHKYMARKLKLEEIDASDAMKFYNENHIAGERGGTFHFGLKDDGMILSCMTVGKSRYKTDEYELIRFANKKDTLISGAFSKIFNHVSTYFINKRIVSYSDLRFGFGHTYKNAGFVFDGVTPPNYYYYNKSKPNGLESRMKYQKHKLTHLSSYDINKTEEQIMLEEGYLKIFDCGNSRWFCQL